jgi:hypothetical protein
LYMGLSNIHDIRKSFHRLRSICSTLPIDQVSVLRIRSFCVNDASEK